MCEHIQRRAEAAGDRNVLLDWSTKSVSHGYWVVTAQQLAEIARGREHVLKATIRDQESLAAALLAVDNARQIDARLADEPAAKLDRKLRLRKCLRPFCQSPGERCSDGFDVQRPVAGEIRDAKASAEVHLGRVCTGLRRDFGCKPDRSGLGFDQGICVERLTTSEDVKSAPVSPGGNQALDERRRTVVVYAELAGQSAHLHSRRDGQRPLSLAVALEIDGDPGAHRGIELLIALAGPGEAYGQAEVGHPTKLPGRGHVEAVDLVGNP